MPLLQGYTISRMIQVANRIGLFAALSEGPAHPRDLSRRLSTHPESLHILCSALASLSLLEKNGERFRIPRQLLDYLSPDGKASLTGSLDLNYDTWSVLTDLEKTIRTGQPVISMMKTIRRDGRRLKNFVNAMHGKAVRAAALIKKKVSLDTVQQMIDVGGGPGTYSLEWARAFPHLRATIFDIPQVLRITQDYIRRYGLQGRVTTRPGNFLTDSLGSGYDLALAANILQMYGPADCRKILTKVHACLAPGGRLILHGSFTDQSGTAPKEAALFSLFISTVTPGGRSHPLSSGLHWLKEAGFTGIRTFEINDIPRTVICGKKPLTSP